MEASDLLHGQSIRLLSRPLRGSRWPRCLRLYYNMYGSGTGELKVRLRKDGEDVLLWQRSGEQSITWLRATVEYQCDNQHQARVQKKSPNLYLKCRPRQKKSFTTTMFSEMYRNKYVRCFSFLLVPDCVRSDQGSITEERHCHR